MKVSEIKKLIETSVSLRDQLSEYIDTYVKWVENTVPKGMEKHFGVGITSDNRFGTYWGFYNAEKGQYTCTGSSWYVGNDWNCEIVGSNTKQQKEFAKEIPCLIDQGLEKISSENKEIEDLIRTKINLTNND